MGGSAGLLILWIVVALVLLYVIYAFLSDLLFKLLHLGTIYKGPATVRKLALTFDDGPDPRYTPQVLDILREHGAQATFFLVGRRAADHPELVRKIRADGHEIASHGYAHKHAWLLHPLATWRDVASAKRTLEAILGERIRFYRPPWGDFNLVTRMACSALRLKPVLWSRRAIDWLEGDHAAAIEERVVSGAHTGAIVLCHDAGGAPKAPLNTIRALPGILNRLGRVGYDFTTVGQLRADAVAQSENMRRLFAGYPLPRRLLIAVWSVVEWVFARVYHIESVNRIFRISPTTWHHGPRVDAEGNTVVADGDKGIDLHFQNDTLISISGARDNRALLRGLRMAKDGFTDLAHMLQFDEKFRDIRVITAPTLMNRGIEMLGFHVEDLPNNQGNRRLQRYMRFLMGMYHPEGFSRLRQGRQELELKLIWMTRDELIQRYGG